MKENEESSYEKNSLSLVGTIAMGTGVMIGAGIFALTGQVAQEAGRWFPLAFAVSALVAATSSYAYIKMSQAHPSSGGIAMILAKAYGKGTLTAGFALLMFFSMVINESLVARTFGTYTLQLFDFDPAAWVAPALGVGLLLFALAINLLGNQAISTFSMVAAVIKVVGIAVFAGVGLWLAGFSFPESKSSLEGSVTGHFLAAVALGLLAYKGFTTITNSGDEIRDPEKNVGRAIAWALVVCFVIYGGVTLAVRGNLTIEEIVGARDYALARAAEPVLGKAGITFTVGLAIVATVSGVIVSAFAVSRMLAMLTEMKLVPHRHFKMPGTVQQHTLVYTIVLAVVLTVFFDLGRIAALGAIFYLVMDVAVQWGVWRHAREEVNAHSFPLLSSTVLNLAILSGLVWIKWTNDPFILVFSGVSIAVIFLGERWFLDHHQPSD